MPTFFASAWLFSGARDIYKRSLYAFVPVATGASNEFVPKCCWAWFPPSPTEEKFQRTEQKCISNQARESSMGLNGPIPCRLTNILADTVRTKHFLERKLFGMHRPFQNLTTTVKGISLSRQNWDPNERPYLGIFSLGKILNQRLLPKSNRKHNVLCQEIYCQLPGPGCDPCWYGRSFSLSVTRCWLNDWLTTLTQCLYYVRVTSLVEEINFVR